MALLLTAGVVSFLGAIYGRTALVQRARPALRVSVAPPSIVADGYDFAMLKIAARANAALTVAVIEGSHRATVERVVRGEDGWIGRIRAGVLPGRVVVRVEAAGFLPATAELTTTLQSSGGEDGTPDFLRLDNEHDRESFRRWFTFLAEAQYYQAAAQRPAEITDCAALIRYCYREALRCHDGVWAAEARLPLAPALDSIEKYDYPHTPLGPELFRVRPAPFRGSDLTDGSFAQFADAQTLQRLNTHFVTRDVLRAEPGDLLFFRQLSEHMPFHSMIYIGRSQIAKDHDRYTVYHTGPSGPDAGEVRRPAIEELLAYPEPRWRPISTNPSFLGVYRWNILDTEF